MILDISRTIFRWYISMVKYFCPSQIIGDNDRIANSPLLSDDNGKLLIKIDESEEIDETYQLISIKGMNERDINEMIDNTDNEIYNEKYKKNYKHFLQNSQTNNSPIKKSYSTSLPVHYCGWCFGSIDSPSHFYMDRVYCNPNCRNYQIIKDDRMSIKKRHTAASFSN